MSRLWLIRHGEAHVNLARDDGLAHVVDEHGLTGVGVEQAKRLARRLTDQQEMAPDLIMSSTFLRASQTATIAAGHFGIPILPDDGLQEWRIGTDAIGVTQEDALASWARICAGEGHDDRLSPGTESHNEFITRVDSTLLQIIDENPGKEILVFTHGGVIGRSFVTFMGLSGPASLVSVRPKHVALTEWEYLEELGESRWTLARYNDISHLD